MPKMKTNRGAAKRLRRTGSGKIRRMRAGKSHILTKKSKKKKAPSALCHAGEQGRRKAHEATPSRVVSKRRGFDAESDIISRAE